MHEPNVCASWNIFGMAIQETTDEYLQSTVLGLVQVNPILCLRLAVKINFLVTSGVLAAFTEPERKSPRLVVFILYLSKVQFKIGVKCLRKKGKKR